MTQREPHPGEAAPVITFRDYLRNCRLGRALAKKVNGAESDEAPDRVGETGQKPGGEAGLLARSRQLAIESGLGPLVRAIDRVMGKAAVQPERVEPRVGATPSSGPSPGPASGPSPGPNPTPGAAPDEPPQEPVPAASLESVGVVLKRSREGYQEGLETVAQTLHIRLVYLQAIEDQRFDRLPGVAYAVGFVRAYADYLGLDSAEMVRRFKLEIEGLERRQELVFPVPVSESKVPGGAIILVSLLLAGLAYGAWFYLTSGESELAEDVPPVPEELGGPPAEQAAGQADETSAPTEPAAETETAAEQSGAEEPDGGAEAEQGSSPGEAAAGPAETAAEQTTEQAAAARSTEAGAAPAAAVAAGETGATAAEAAAETPAGAGQALAEAQDSSEPRDPLTLARVLRRPADLVPQQGQSGGGQPGASAGRPGEAGRPSQTSQANAVQEASGRTALERAGSRQPLPGSPNYLGVPPESGAIPAAPETAQLAARSESRTPQVFGAENESTRIVLRATQDSWVQIRDANDVLLLTRVLRRGDEYRVPDKQGLTLLTGNAGGIEVVVDGAALSPLGPVGAVRRGVALDPDRLLEGTAQRP